MAKKQIAGVRRALFKKISENKIMQKIFAFQKTPFYIGALCLLVVLVHTFSLDFLGLYLLIVVNIFTVLFNPDTKPALPSLIYLMFCVSVKNAPTESNLDGLYAQTSSFVQLGILAGLLIIALVIRMMLTPELKKKFRSASLLWGLMALSVGLILNGVFSKSYMPLSLAFGFLYAFLYLIVYLFFFVTVQWDKKSIDYLAMVLFAMGLLITVQLAIRYLTCKELMETFEKAYVTLGWGVSNAVAYTMVISLPFGFYFMKKSKCCLPFYLLTFIIFLGIIFTFSRGTMVVAVPLAVAGVVYTCFSAKERLSAIIASGFVLLAAVIIFAMFHEKILSILNFYIETGFDDRGRFEIWEQGIQNFLKAPVFGIGFIGEDSFILGIFYWYHNTLVQFLASGGIIGLGTYTYHRVESFLLFVKKPTLGRFFIGIAVCAILLNGMFDLVMNMPQVLLCYSALLAFADLDYHAVKTAETEKKLAEAGKSNDAVFNEGAAAAAVKIETSENVTNQQDLSAGSPATGNNAADEKKDG